MTCGQLDWFLLPTRYDQTITSQNYKKVTWHLLFAFPPPIPLSGADALSGDGYFRRLSRSSWTVCCSGLQWISQVNIFIHIYIYYLESYPNLCLSSPIHPSTVSSSINALAAVTVEDLLRPYTNMSEKQLSWMSKGMSEQAKKIPGGSELIKLSA